MLPTLILLLVEDEPAIRALLNEALQDGGFDIMLAENGTKAIAIVEVQSDSFRGLITDIDLGPGPDGWEVARRARECNHDIPVVYMSGASAHDWASHGVPNSTMVAKPFAPAQIITAISALLNVTDTR